MSYFKGTWRGHYFDADEPIYKKELEMQLTRRARVVQSSETVGYRVLEAIRRKEFMELDLMTDTGETDQVRFEVRTTDHDKEGSIIIGVTDDNRTINVHLQREDVYATILP